MSFDVFVQRFVVGEPAELDDALVHLPDELRENTAVVRTCAELLSMIVTS